jgi:hypothetical protein
LNKFGQGLGRDFLSAKLYGSQKKEEKAQFFPLVFFDAFTSKNIGSVLNLFL